MANYDVFMLIVLIAAALWGAYKGLAWQVASISSLVVSYIVACRYRTDVAPLMPVGAPFNLLVAMLVLFMGTNLAVWILFRLVKNFIDRVKLREFDHQMGLLLGAAKGVLLCALITLAVMTFGGENLRRKVVHSRSGYYIAWLWSRSHPWIPSEVREIVLPYVENFQRQWEDVEQAAPGDKLPIDRPPRVPVRGSDHRAGS